MTPTLNTQTTTNSLVITGVMQAVTPTTPMEATHNFARAKTTSMMDARPISMLSEATEIFDTDFEDESDYEEASPKGSFDSVRRYILQPWPMTNNPTV